MVTYIHTYKLNYETTIKKSLVLFQDIIQSYMISPIVLVLFCFVWGCILQSGLTKIVSQSCGELYIQGKLSISRVKLKELFSVYLEYFERSKQLFLLLLVKGCPNAIPYFFQEEWLCFCLSLKGRKVKEGCMRC